MLCTHRTTQEQPNQAETWRAWLEYTIEFNKLKQYSTLVLLLPKWMCSIESSSSGSCLPRTGFPELGCSELITTCTESFLCLNNEELGVLIWRSWRSNSSTNLSSPLHINIHWEYLGLLGDGICTSRPYLPNTCDIFMFKIGPSLVFALIVGKKQRIRMFTKMSVFSAHWGDLSQSILVRTSLISLIPLHWMIKSCSFINVSESHSKL